MRWNGRLRRSLYDSLTKRFMEYDSGKHVVRTSCISDQALNKIVHSKCSVSFVETGTVSINNVIRGYRKEYRRLYTLH